MLRRRLWDSQVGSWYLSNGCSTTRSDRQKYVKSRATHSMTLSGLPLTRLSDIVPVIMAGIIGIYGLVVSVLISDNLKQEMALYTGFIQLGAGLSVGLAGLAAGYVTPCIPLRPPTPSVTTANQGNAVSQLAS